MMKTKERMGENKRDFFRYRHFSHFTLNKLNCSPVTSYDQDMMDEDSPEIVPVNSPALDPEDPGLEPESSER
jgi:hypothetical protein